MDQRSLPRLFSICDLAIVEDERLVEGAKVSFVKGQDERSGRDRAQNVTGGSTEEPGGPGGPQGDPGSGAAVLVVHYAWIST